MLMQHILPIAVQKILPANVVKVLIELSNFFKQLCSKVNTMQELEKIQDRIVLTLCHLEKIFPPSFFDIIEHLPIHLAAEALIAGAVQFRWIYPIERYLYTLKKYVRNLAYPEGSIEKGYLMEECMNFCSRYMSGVETKENRQPHNLEEDDNGCRTLGKGRHKVMDRITVAQVHQYIVANSEVVAPFRNLHEMELSRARWRASKR
ncbi:hypothetical protein LIER_30060 [Lithospermum erythrorhizon]|uniref:DUF4218 domain-containing protein n=1 Tax=Lithospermum erythrorhizon TaxID=34254 RepID=A0AAV3RQB3_LITER